MFCELLLLFLQGLFEQGYYSLCRIQLLHFLQEFQEVEFGPEELSPVLVYLVQKLLYLLLYSLSFQYVFYRLQVRGEQFFHDELLLSFYLRLALLVFFTLKLEQFSHSLHILLLVRVVRLLFEDQIQNGGRGTSLDFLSEVLLHEGLQVAGFRLPKGTPLNVFHYGLLVLVFGSASGHGIEGTLLLLLHRVLSALTFDFGLSIFGKQDDLFITLRVLAQLLNFN